MITVPSPVSSRFAVDFTRNLSLTTTPVNNAANSLEAVPADGFYRFVAAWHVTAVGGGVTQIIQRNIAGSAMAALARDGTSRTLIAANTTLLTAGTGPLLVAGDNFYTIGTTLYQLFYGEVLIPAGAATASILGVLTDVGTATTNRSIWMERV